MASKLPLQKIALEVTIFGLVATAALQYQSIIDQYALATFKPAPRVAEVERRLTLTPHGRAVLYRARPEILDKAAFNDQCETSRSELELGCFYKNRIYVLRIENQSLASEMDVVLAHELLHAAWGRLSVSEREELGIELRSVYQKVVDRSLEERMAGYARTEPGQELNELHSILPTEYVQSTPRLEAHYRRYFRDRQVIVRAHATYEDVFRQRRAELERELSQIRELKTQLITINNRLNSYRRANQVGEYNALIPRQNQLVKDINQRIDAYKKAVEEYNGLSKSLDSQQLKGSETPI